MRSSARSDAPTAPTTSELEGAGARAAALPHALDHLAAIRARMSGSVPAFFFDYDGTLTPIVGRPDDARLSARMREALRELARTHRVAVVSGRDLSDLRARVGVDEVTYAGGHGLAVVGPDLVFEHDALRDAAPRLARACEDLRDRIGAIDGVELELKGGALAVHYRRADAARERSVESAARDVAESIGGLRCTYGKKIVELRPDVAWDKGRAVRLLVRRWFAPEDRVVPIYVGDDLTDEDAFRELARDGLGVLVGDHGGHTRARYALADSDEVFDFVGAMREIDSVTCETDSGAT